MCVCVSCVCVCARVSACVCASGHYAQAQNKDMSNEDRRERIIGREWRRFGRKLRHNKR